MAQTCPPNQWILYFDPPKKEAVIPNNPPLGVKVNTQLYLLIIIIKNNFNKAIISNGKFISLLKFKFIKRHWLFNFFSRLWIGSILVIIVTSYSFENYLHDSIKTWYWQTCRSNNCNFLFGENTWLIIELTWLNKWLETWS